MKTRIIYPLLSLAFLMLSSFSAQSQQLDVPGDNFSLEGALELFKQSSSPQEFERMLNSPEEKVNNLDLNGDGYIDYIKVIDIQDGNVHAFVMQAVISENQFQDIAVITLEKQANGKAILQITGDEDIYGVETIIEPTREVRTYAGTQSSRVYVNVWSWPIVSYVYGPYYSVWVSPWSWGFRPVWWSPWRPIVYVDYYSYWRPYYRYYSPCYTTRIVHAHTIYRPHRTTSVVVSRRYNDRISRYRSTHLDRDGRYRSTNDRTTRSRSQAVRYDQNGRIRSDSRANNSRISDYTRTSRTNTESRQRTSATPRTRSSNEEYSRNTQRYSTNRNTERTTRSATENSNIRRSTDSRSSYRSSDNTNNQRSRSYSTSPSSGNTRMRSSERSGGNSYQRSSGSAPSRSSSGNSGYQRSSGRSSNNATIQRSPSSSRSSGNTNSSRSSGNSGSSRSSGSSRGRSR